MDRSPPPAPAAVIGVCVSCRAADGTDAGGEELLARLKALAADDPAQGPAVGVRAVRCLSVCKRPCSAALSGPGRYTYVFGDLLVDTGADALLACARAYLAAEHGYLLWRERPEPLRRGIVARIPPPEWGPDDGGHPR